MEYVIAFAAGAVAALYTAYSIVAEQSVMLVHFFHYRG